MARSHRVPPGPRVEASAERVAGGRPGAGAAEPGHTPQAVPGRSPGEVVADSPEERNQEAVANNAAEGIRLRVGNDQQQLLVQLSFFQLFSELENRVCAVE